MSLSFLAFMVTDLLDFPCNVAGGGGRIGGMGVLGLGGELTWRVSRCGHLEAQQVRTLGSPTGVRTLKPNRCAHEPAGSFRVVIQTTSWLGE